jgi:hypothetical protein
MTKIVNKDNSTDEKEKITSKISNYEDKIGINFSHRNGLHHRLSLTIKPSPPPP